MALNTSPVRSDIAYLRRRTKPAPVVEQAAAAVQQPVQQAVQPPARQAAAAPPPEPRSVPSAGLTLAPAARGAATSAAGGSTATPFSAPTSTALTNTAPAKATPRAVDPATLPFSAPTIDDLRELGADDPVLRLNARESAVGSLIVTGADVVVWENADRVTGMASVAGEIVGSAVTTAGNRPLVGFDDADAIVALRHAGDLRRALFVAHDRDTLGVQIFDGSTVTVERGNESRTFVLYLLRVGNLLELRAEPVARGATPDAILAQFGFEITPFVAPRETRSR